MKTTEIMTIPEVARYLKLAPITIYKLVGAKKMPSRRVGRSLRFPKPMIDEWLKNQEAPSRGVEASTKQMVAEFAKKARQKLGKQIMEIKLYGSRARGKEHADSDIDVAVIVKRKSFAQNRELSALASEVSLAHDKLLSLVVIEKEVYQKGLKETYPFYQNIQAEGISF